MNSRPRIRNLRADRGSLSRGRLQGNGRLAVGVWGPPDAAPAQKTHPGGPDGQGDGTGPSCPWVESDSAILSLLAGSPHGVHPLRNRRCRRAAELEREAGVRESDRCAMAVSQRTWTTAYFCEPHVPRTWRKEIYEPRAPVGF
jgi:hypothetical protein